jgi:trans-2,3-dihydro-3-hydroxyanthranilate isomerase
MAREYDFVQVDVFTERIFGGNPLAVFLDGRGLDEAAMLAIAREMNLSETTFVLPATRADCAVRVRIFTPAREIPFAGHPTVGTAWVLAMRGRLGGAPRASLEEGIGPVGVELEGDPARPAFVWMRHGDVELGPPLSDRAGVAKALGLDETSLHATAPIRVGSTGRPFLYVPLRDRMTVDRAALDVAALKRVAGEAVPGVFVFTPEKAGAYSRMFAPHVSRIAEDPATGAASGPLGAYLVLQGLVRGGESVRLVSEQGTQMGRQSYVHIRLRGDERGVTDIAVGGSVVPVLEGQLTIP